MRWIDTPFTCSFCDKVKHAGAFRDSDTRPYTPRPYMCLDCLKDARDLIPNENEPPEQPDEAHDEHRIPDR